MSRTAYHHANVAYSFKAQMDSLTSLHFDAYHKWLGIPPDEQPPNYYRLLGIPLFETDAEVIAAAADRQMAHVKGFASGPYPAQSQLLLNELARARVTLLHPRQKSVYDKSLKAKGIRSAFESAGQTQPQAQCFGRVAEADELRHIATRESLHGRQFRRRRHVTAPWTILLPLAGVLSVCTAALYLDQPAFERQSGKSSRTINTKHLPAPSIQSERSELKNILDEKVDLPSVAPTSQVGELTESEQTHPPIIESPDSILSIKLNLKSDRQVVDLGEVDGVVAILELRNCNRPYAIAPDGALRPQRPVQIVVEGERDVIITAGERIRGNKKAVAEIAYSFVNSEGAHLPMSVPRANRMRASLIKEIETAVADGEAMQLEYDSLNEWLKSRQLKPLAQRGEARRRLTQLRSELLRQEQFVTDLLDELEVADDVTELVEHLEDECELVVEFRK
jgi:hypothetical protein